MSIGNDTERAGAIHINGRAPVLKALCHAVALLLLVCATHTVRAQSQTDPPALFAPPVVDAIDENNVSILSGQEQFTVPAIKMGDVSFTPFSFDSSHFGIATDENYGRVADCAAQELVSALYYTCRRPRSHQDVRGSS